MIQVSNPYSVPPPPLPLVSSNAHLFQPIQFKPFKPPDGEFDGKRLRKSVMRKTVDYNSSVVQMLEARLWQKDERARLALPPDICFASEILPPPAYLTNPINAVVTKFVRTSTNKAKCPIFCLAWTPEGRRLVTGASSGEFTLWNGLTFNFETILQAHESSVRAMVWSHNDQWMVTGDTSGYVKYWQTNMNNVKMFQAHKDPVRGLSFSPSDQKIATGSDDGTVRIWDFFRCQEERVLRGHGADVKCVDWHPSKSLLASGSKDNQQPIKLWDPRTGTSLAKLHAHKSTVMDLKWNANGTWLCSASRDHLLKLFDIRNFSTELQIFRGHKKEASSIAWHPQHEGLFSSGGSDGSILFWHVGNDKEVGAIESAHDGIIWDMAWHPLGHLLCSGSNDHTSKFWTRNRPGDKMRDKYNLNTLPPGVVGDDCVDIDDIPVSASYIMQPTIPGMGPDDKVEAEPEPKGPETIPGLEFDSVAFAGFLKKTPYAKPIPKTFQAAWNAAGGLEEDMEEDQSNNWVIVESELLFSKPAITEGDAVITDFGEQLPPGSIPLSDIKADAIAYYGFYIPLPAVPGDVIQDAFAFNEEEEALAEITNDVDFARKLIREKRGLYNPSQGGDDSKQDDRPEKKFTPKENQRGNFNKGNNPNNFHGSFNGRIHPDGMPPHQHFNGPPGHFNAGPPGPFNNGPPSPFNAGPPGAFNNGPPGQFNNGPPVQFNNGPPGPFNNGPPGQFNNGPPGMFNNGPSGRPGNFAPNSNFNQNNFPSNDFKMPNYNIMNPNISNMPNPNIHMGNANNNIMQESPHSEFNRRHGPSHRYPNEESRGEDRELPGNFRENDRHNRFPLRDGENDREDRFPPRDGRTDRDGRFPLRGRENDRDSRFTQRDGGNNRDDRFPPRDGGNDRDGFLPRDGGNDREGRFLQRDGGNDREGRFPHRDAGNDREDRFPHRDGGNDRDNRFHSRDGGKDGDSRFPSRDGGNDRDFNFENADRNFFRDGGNIGERIDRDFRGNDDDKDRNFNRGRNRDGEELDRSFRNNERGDRVRGRGDRSGRWPSGDEEDRHWRDKRDLNEGDDQHSKGDWGGKRGAHGKGRTRGPWRESGQRRNF